MGFKPAACGAIILAYLTAASPVIATPVSGVAICASDTSAAAAQNFYANTRPGVPLSVASRALAIPESQIATGLAQGQSVAVAGEHVRHIWRSIDNWGAETPVKLVFADRGHSFAFPSLVPITQPNDEDDDFLDVYADGGRGVHAHVRAPEVAMVAAFDMPTRSPEKRTRGIGLYGDDGRLIMAIYASLNLEEADVRAVVGFAATWELMRTLPRHCG
jgi:putative heme iron utilization protein